MRLPEPPAHLNLLDADLYRLVLEGWLQAGRGVEAASAMADAAVRPVAITARRACR